MFAIGEFARHGRVSVRMLRHYDAIGLPAYYEDTQDLRGSITVHAALPIAEPPAGRPDFTVMGLSDIPAPATLIHHGSMDGVLPAVQALARWIDAGGYQSLGYAREVTLQFGDVRDDWITELQEPIAPRDAA